MSKKSAKARHNPYDPSFSTRGRFRWLARLLLLLTYPFLVLSLLLLGGSGFGSAFVVQFVIQNDTCQPIEVTPVGAVGPQGERRPLPVYFWRFPAFPASQRGGFYLGPGESISILYSMDDINFSEIVVKDFHGFPRQLVVNPNPTIRRYHAPSQRRFVIHDVTALDPVPGPVLAAAKLGESRTIRPWIIFGLIFLPWLMFVALSRLNRRLSHSASYSHSGPQNPSSHRKEIDEPMRDGP